MKFMTCTWPPPDLEKKSPTVYVTDPGKRQVICRQAELKWQWQNEARHRNPIISKPEYSPFHLCVCVCV